MSKQGAQVLNVVCALGVVGFVVLAFGDFARADMHEAEAERLRNEAERLRKAAGQ